MTDTLDVYLHGRLAGRLTHEAGDLRFVYDADYLDERPIALSLSLPLQEAPFPTTRSLPFFEGLLPEGRIRERLAAQLGISGDNPFGLLARVGGDCAGAVQLFAPGDEPAGQATEPAEPLDEKTLGEVLREINRRPFVYDRQGRGQRLSLAGAQRKLPVVIDRDGVVHLPGDAPSTHILKPPSDEYDELVVNEYLCLRAAALAGLAAPPVTFRAYRRRDGSEWHALQIERYDREYTETGVRRIHQEDFCQALGLPSSLKYEEEGGPDLADCHRLVVEHTRPPAIYQRRFLQWTFFNLLVGNCDAHAKNLALLHTTEGCRLSPVYDIVSTQIYAPRLTDRLAMSVGGARRVSELNRDALLQLGRDLDINIRIARDMLGPFVDRAHEAIERAAEEARLYCRAPRIIDRIRALAGDRRRLLGSVISTHANDKAC